MGASEGMMPARAARLAMWGPIIAQAFMEHRLPVVWGVAIARQESDFDPSKVNMGKGDARRGGSFGLMQVSLKTARIYAPNVTPEQLLDPKTNAKISAMHCAILGRRYRELADVASAYNSGEPLNRAPQGTRSIYVPRVLTFAANYQEAAARLERQVNGH